MPKIICRLCKTGTQKRRMFVYASVGPVFSSVSLDASLTLSDTHTHIYALTNYHTHTLLVGYSPGHEDRSELR